MTRSLKPKSTQEIEAYRLIFVPSELKGQKAEFPEVGAVVYVGYNRKGKPAAMGFSGKRTKADWHYYFQTIERAEAHINEWLASLKRSRDFRAENKAKDQLARSVGHGLEVGMILTGSWGYDQTNVEFYQVVRVSGSAVWIQEVGQEEVKTHAFMSEDVVPDKGRLFGPILRRIPRVTQHGVYVKLHDSCSLSKWDGRARYQSHYA